MVRLARCGEKRQVDGLGDRAEVTVEPLLRRLVVVRDDGQAALRAGLFANAVSAIASDVAAPPGRDSRIAREIDRRLDQEAVLVDIDGGRLTRRADDDDPRGPILDVEVDQLAQGGEVERSAGAHRCRDRDETAGQH
jgi:hypothetical protein